MATTTATDALTEAGRALGYDGGLTLAVGVKDMEASIRFYEDVVGFKLQYKIDDMGWCELTTSVPQVNLGLSQVEKPETTMHVTPTFGVENIDRARKVLEERGARFDGETMELPGMVKLATFFDLDGNPIKLFEVLSTEAP